MFALPWMTLEMTDGDGMSKQKSVWDAQADDMANSSSTYMHTHNVVAQTQDKDEEAQDRTKKEKEERLIYDDDEEGARRRWWNEVSENSVEQRKQWKLNTMRNTSRKERIQ